MRRRTATAQAFQPGFDFLPPSSATERRYRIHRELAGDPTERLEQGRAWLKQYDAAIRGGDEAQASEFADRLYAVGDAMPDDDEDEELTGHAQLTKLLAAAPGQVPLWGQSGTFLITVKKCRVVVHADGDFHFELTAFDWDRPFLSESGYLSLYGDADDARGRTVKQCVTKLAQERSKKPVKMVRTRWDHDTRTRQEIPVGPDPDDVDWQPGGWLYELKQKR